MTRGECADPRDISCSNLLARGDFNMTLDEICLIAEQGFTLSDLGQSARAHEVEALVDTLTERHGYTIDEVYTRVVERGRI